MAALIPKNGLLLINRQTPRAVSAATQICHYSDKPTILKDPTTASLKKGTGGRSSFNGIVCTVFGCTGFIGKHLINRLGKIGTQLILPYRGDQYDVLPLKLCGDLGQTHLHPYDIRDEESIRRCIKYSNVVINCIGRNWETPNFSFQEVNVDGARRIARICKEMGIERLIHFSSLTASPNPPPIHIKGGSKCLKSKWFGEQAVREEFPEAIIIRPSSVYGQDDHFLGRYCHVWRQLARGVNLWKKGEETEKQPIWVGDVGRGIISIIKNHKISGQTYQFVGPRRYKLSDLVDWINHSIRYDALGYGYEREDTQWNPMFWSKIMITEALCRTYPYGYMHREGIEQEHVSDVVKKGIPTLEDLGVDNLALLEDRGPWELKIYRKDAAEAPEIGEYLPPPFPPHIPIKLVDEAH